MEMLPDDRAVLRASYRRLSIRSHQTTSLRERAALQAAAARIHRALYASGQFDGAVLVLLVEGDNEVEYDEGDTAPLHCTVCYLGDAADIDPDDDDRITALAERISNSIDPFDATVVSDATFGETPVKLVEHDNINAARDLAMEDPDVAVIAGFAEDHPGYLPHVSGLDDRETVRFDRLAIMRGGDISEFPLGALPDTDDDLDLDEEDDELDDLGVLT